MHSQTESPLKCTHALRQLGRQATQGTKHRRHNGALPSRTIGEVGPTYLAAAFSASDTSGFRGLFSFGGLALRLLARLLLLQRTQIVSAARKRQQQQQQH